MLQHNLTDEDKELITDYIRARAAFEPGDRVTVEPRDGDFGYAGDRYEGTLLTVESVSWDEVRYADEYDESEHPESVLKLEDGTKVRVGQPRYQFREGVHGLTEHGLISWEEYREEHDCVYLPPSEEHPQSGDTSIWLEPAEENCELCGCNLRRHSFWDNGVVQAGREVCPACGDVKAEHTP